MEAIRHGDSGFEHHSELPMTELGSGRALVIAGAFGGVRSPARMDHPAVSLDVSFRGSLYRSARVLGDAQALASGNRRRITRRAKNKLVGRALGRSGFWRFLWR